MLVRFVVLLGVLLALTGCSGGHRGETLPSGTSVHTIAFGGLVFDLLEPFEPVLAAAQAAEQRVGERDLHGASFVAAAATHDGRVRSVPPPSLYQYL